MKVVKTKLKNCKGCKICEHICPEKAISMKRVNGMLEIIDKN